MYPSLAFRMKGVRCPRLDVCIESAPVPTSLADDAHGRAFAGSDGSSVKLSLALDAFNLLENRLVLLVLAGREF